MSIFCFRFRSLVIAVCSLVPSFDSAWAAEGDPDNLPAIEIRSKRSHYDPRDVPQTVNGAKVEGGASYGGQTLANTYVNGVAPRLSAAGSHSQIYCEQALI